MFLNHYVNKKNAVNAYYDITGTTLTSTLLHQIHFKTKPGLILCFMSTASTTRSPGPPYAGPTVSKGLLTSIVWSAPPARTCPGPRSPPYSRGTRSTLGGT